MVSTEVLRRFPFFAGFAEPHLEVFAKVGQVVTLEPETILFRPDEKIHTFHMLAKGQVSLFLVTPPRFDEGDSDTTDLPTSRITIDSIKAGQALGWSSVFPPFEATCGAMTASRCEFLTFESAALLAAFDANPEFGYAVFRKLALVIHERLQNRRMEDLWSISHD